MVGVKWKFQQFEIHVQTYTYKICISTIRIQFLSNTSIQQSYRPHMDLYIKDIQQMEYQLASSERLVLSRLYQRLTFDPIPKT